MEQAGHMPRAGAILIDAVAIWAGAVLLLWLAGGGAPFVGVDPRGFAMSPVAATGFLASAGALRLGRSGRPTARWLSAALGGLVTLLLVATMAGLEATGAGAARMSLSSVALFAVILVCLWTWRGGPVFLLALFGMSSALGMLATYGLDTHWPAASTWRWGMSVQSAALFFVLFLGIGMAPDRPGSPRAMPSFPPRADV